MYGKVSATRFPPSKKPTVTTVEGRHVAGKGSGEEPVKCQRSESANRLFPLSQSRDISHSRPGLCIALGTRSLAESGGHLQHHSFVRYIPLSAIVFVS